MQLKNKKVKIKKSTLAATVKKFLNEKVIDEDKNYRGMFPRLTEEENRILRKA